MISKRAVKRYCENYTEIENYEKAVSSPEIWDCHHRFETMCTAYKPTGQELKDWNLYYNRPAGELVFLTHSEHMSLHMKGKPSYNKGKQRSEETKIKISEARKGMTLSEETKRNISEAMKGKKHSEEYKQKMSKLHKGKHWKLVDGKRVWY